MHYCSKESKLIRKMVYYLDLRRLLLLFYFPSFNLGISMSDDLKYSSL
jgi:hypothetical protein